MIGAGCGARPAECDARYADRLAALDKNGLVGLRSRTAATDIVKGALAAAQKQDERFALFRSYQDVVGKCVAAGKAVQDAEAAATAALAKKPQAEAIDGEAKAKIASAQRTTERAVTLLDTGLFGEAETTAHQRARRAFDEARQGLERARAQMSASGFENELGDLEAARTNAIQADAAATQGLAALVAGLAQKCKLPDAGLAAATLQMHDGWLVVHVPETQKAYVLEIAREKKSCRTLYARAADAASIADTQDALATWTIPGPVVARVLVGWNESRAWFLDGARLLAFSHAKAGGFSKACAPHVTCGKPRIGTKTIEADCDCGAPPSAGMLPSDLKRTARYAWDGNHVIAEP
jgi:hypothetical protein